MTEPLGAPDLIGRKISHYRVLGELGRGGMGVLYRAEDLRLGREVALKFLRPEAAGEPRLMKRLQLEARAASALNHPHICTVHDIDEHEGRHFIVMELLEGATLAEKLREGPLSLDAALDAGIQISDALAAAHSKGIIHRDIKPGNVFLTPDGCVKLLDFGVAKLQPEVSLLTTSAAGLALALTDHLTSEGTPAGLVLGTVAYMSPEQLRGEELDARTDIFSTGALLYEVTTGRLPFTGATVAEMAAAILDHDPAPPSRLDGTLSRAFDGVVLTALAKRRECRQRSIAALRDDLEAIRRGRRPVSAADRRTWSRRRVVAWGGLLAAACAGALAVTSLAHRHTTAPPSGPLIESLAVLPLRELSAGPEQSYLADGMTEALIARLAQLRGVRVISRTSAMLYKNTQKPLRQIGEELGVQAVVEGSVLGSGGRVQVTARLVSAQDDRSVWSATYERELKDVLVLEGEISRAIAQEIQVAITPQEAARLARAHPVDPEAHDLYLRGRVQMGKGTPDAVETALKDFQAAVERDPSLALAWVGIADVFSWLCTTGYDRLPPREAWPRAKAAAQRALEIEPSGEAHIILADAARVFDHEPRKAEDEYERALQLSPGSATVHHFYSGYLSNAGRAREAVAEARKAIELDPFSLSARDALAWNYYFAGCFQEAARVSQQTLAVEPSFPYSHMQLGMNLLAQRRPSEALAEFERFRTLSGDSSISRALTGHAQGVLGEREQARAILREMETQSTQRYVPAYHIAVVYAGLGDCEHTLLWWEKAVDERSGAVLLPMNVAMAECVRSDRRFQHLVQRLRVRYIPSKCALD